MGFEFVRVGRDEDDGDGEEEENGDFDWGLVQIEEEIIDLREVRYI